MLFGFGTVLLQLRVARMGQETSCHCTELDLTREARL